MTEEIGEQSTLAADGSTRGTPTPRPPGDLVLEAQRTKVFGALFTKPKLRRVGRYVVLDVLGQGGMGVVLKGYDDELDRQVAIKVLHADLGERHTTRLRREAQALAKLSHPNVVQVYEVGELEGQTFVAMELCKGQTVRQWLEQEPRPDWKECVEVFIQLGQGLAAAHKRGLVHRDFKPGNAIIDEEGRARVLDFGLARRGEEGEQDDPPSWIQRKRTDEHEVVALEQSLTQTGAVLGTPAYMPPEQMDGDEADARSDQFSFCVALYEAVYGERPYEGETMMALLVSMRAGEVQPGPKGSDVPMALRKVLLRGLAVEPADRWRSMDALLDELRRLIVPRRRRSMAFGVTVGLLAVGVGLGVTQWLEWKNRCTGAHKQLEGAWDDARRQEVKAAITGTGLSYASGTWEWVEPRLDAYAEEWAAEHADTCEATRSRDEQTEEEMSQRMRCLRERRQHLRATVDQLSHADATVMEHAVQAVTNMPRPEQCRDLEVLRAEVPPPGDPTVAEQVKELGELLVEAKAKEEAGKYEDALRLADEIVEGAVLLDYEPLMARAWLWQGRLRDRTGEYEGAVQVLSKAYEAAMANTMIAEAAEASTELMSVLGHRLARYQEARSWALHAGALSRAAKTNEARVRYLYDLAFVALTQAEYEEARNLFGQARDTWEEALGADHPKVARALDSLGFVAVLQDDHEGARDFYEGARDILEKALGPDHPDVASSLETLGNLAASQGKYEEARDFFERALAIYEKALDPNYSRVAVMLDSLGLVAALRGKHGEARDFYERARLNWKKAPISDEPHVMVSLTNLGGVALLRGKYEEARHFYERALAVKEKASGPDHPEVVGSLINLGSVALLRGKYGEARHFYERALAVEEKASGPEVAGLLASLGSVAASQGKYEEARDFYERSLAVEEKALGPDHPNMVYPLINLGKSLLDLAKPADALPFLERALVIRATHEVDPTVLAATRFALARALWTAPSQQGRDRPRARLLAEQAHDAYASLGDASKTELAEVQTWLGDHRLR